MRPGGQIDVEAKNRGNSVYLPDIVMPMLPENLSNNLCSLIPKKIRPCLAVHIWIDFEGNLLRHRFCRGIMKSKARLNYAQVQMAKDGNPDHITRPLQKTIINPLFGAFNSLSLARKKRKSLDIDMPEKKIRLSKNNQVINIESSDKYETCFCNAYVSFFEEFV